MGSDDFDFTPKAAEGVERLQEVLDLCSEVDIASGKVNNRFYEFELIDKGDTIIERPVSRFYTTECLWCIHCDLTVNYFLARNKVFDRIRWDDDVKIGGGEHGAFFVDCKRAGFKTVNVPSVNIDEQQIRNSARYNEFRNRARNPERPCFVKRGIKKYVLGNGQIDYKEKS
jgi:hypothetical protein